MASENVEVAERFRVALEAAVRTGDRAGLCATCARRRVGHTSAEAAWDQRHARELELGSSPESFDYAFEEGEWVDDGEGRLVCDVRQVYRVKESGDVAYQRIRRVRLTVREGKIGLYEISVIG